MVNCLNRIGDSSSKSVKFCGNPAKTLVSSTEKAFDLPLNDYLEALNPSCSKDVLNKMPRLVRCLNSVKNWMGEFGSTCVNAFGTGLIAPIFIAWNPISKADDKTKKYSALRQPLSAVLAVTTSAAVTIPFNKLVATLADNGLLANSVNRNLVKSDKIIRKEILDRRPNISKKDLEAIFLQAKQNEYRTAYKYFYNNGTFNGWNDIVMKPEERNALVLKTMESVEEEVTNDIKKYEGEVYPEYKKRLMYFFENKDKTAAYFDELQQYFNSDKGKTKKEAKAFYKRLKENYNAEELKKITYEISTCKTKDEQKSLFDKILKYHREVKRYTNKEQVETFLSNDKQLKVEPLKEIQKFIKEAQKEFKNCSSDNVLAFLQKWTNRGATLITDPRIKGLNKNLIFEIVKKEVENAENRFKSYKNITGLILGMLTIPVSCSILNWMYPRFVELFFPSLCSDNTEEKIPKKEVKGVKTW